MKTETTTPVPATDAALDGGPAVRRQIPVTRWTRPVSTTEFLEAFARTQHSVTPLDSTGPPLQETASESPLALTSLLTLYRLIAQSEGKSKNTIAITVSAVRDLNRYLVQQGLSTEAPSVDVNVLRQYVIDLQVRPPFPQHRFTPPQAGKLSPSTINGYPRAQRVFFACLKREGVIAENPFDRLVLPKVPTKVIPCFSDEQLVNLFGAIDPASSVAARDEAILMMLLDTGVRLGELISLPLEGVDLKQRLITVTGKGNKQRQVPIGARLQSALWQYIHLHRPTPAMPRYTQVFLTTEGRPLKKDRLEAIVRRYGQRAGITGVRVSPHTFRHTFSIRYLRNGGDVFRLQAILGHARLDSVKIYLYLAQTDLNQAHLTCSPADNLDLPLKSLPKPRGRRSP